MCPLRSAPAPARLPRTVFYAAFAAAAASAFTVDVAIERDLVLHAHASAEGEVVLSEPVDDWTLLRCASLSSAVVVAHRGVRARYCPRHRLTWLPNPHETSLPLSYVANACARLGQRPCRYRELCSDPDPTLAFPARTDNHTTSLVVTAEGAAVDVGEPGGTCTRSLDAGRSHFGNTTAQYRALCCAEDLCDPVREGDVVVPPGHASSYPTLLSLRWSRRGRAVVRCEAYRGGALRGSFDVRVRSLPPPDAGGGVVLERSPVYLHPGQEAHLSVRLSGPPATGRALVRCWTSAGGRVEGRVLSFTDATFAVAQRLELRWDDAWSVAAASGGGTETVVCTYNGADVGGVGKVVRRVGAALRLVDAAGRALPRAAPLVLAEDAAVLGFGLEVTGVPSRAANPAGWPTATHQAACELLPGSDRLLLLRPVPLEFAAGPATLWFAVVRGRRQFSEYTVRLRCRNGRAPSAGYGTLWELHPDEAAVERDVIVRVPRAVDAHRARLAVAAPAALAKGGTAALELLMTRRPVQPTRVTCRASSDAVTLRPSAAARFVGVVEERVAAAEPLLTGSLVAFRYSGPQHRYNGTQWLSCEGGGEQACRLAACAGDEMDGEEWGACAAATFALHAARPASDRHHPLQPRGVREAVRNGDLVLLAAPDALNATVTCATATDRCVPGDSCAASFPPLRGDYVACNSTLRLWAAGRVEGDTVRRGDAVSLLWAPASAADSAAAGDRWMGCLGASEEVVSEVGERQCSAAYYDTCPGHTPQEGVAFTLPEACASYGFTLHTLDLEGEGATPAGWGLYSYATDAPLSRPLLGEAPVWRRVGSDVSSVGVALSGASASVLLRGGAGGDDVRLTLGRNGTYALRAAAPRWLRRGRGVAAGCVEDYTAVLGTPAECRERCENTTGCAFVSFPHWDGCRVHAGTQPSCVSVGNGSTVATPTQTATLAPVSEAEEALYAPPAAVGDWNGALEVGGGRIVQVLQPGTPLLDFTFDAWVRPVAAAAAWTLRDADTGTCLQRRGGDCNETWAAAPLPNNSIALSMGGGFCVPRDDCGTPVQWLPEPGGAGYLVLPGRPGYCVDAAGAAVDDATFAACARWVRTVAAGGAETPLLATIGTRSALGTGLFLSSAGVVSFDVGDGSSRVSVASPPLPAGEWAHVAGVLDRVAGRARLYVDGTLAGAVATGEVAGVLSPTVLWMGGEAATRAFIDNVAVWRAPLSAEQALQRTLCRAVRGHDLLALAVSFTFRNGAVSDAFGHASYAFGAVVDPLVRGAACDGFNSVLGWRPAGVGTLLPAAAEGACEARCLADAECAGFARDAATGDCDLLSGVSFAGPYTDDGVSWHAKAPSLLRRAPRRRRVAAEAIAEAACSSVSERNSTCAMAVDGVRGPAYVGEWASRSETVGAWLTLRLAAPHTLTHVRVAQRAYGAAQAKQVRVCVEGGGGGRSCVVRTLAPATAVHPVPRWEGFELAGGGSEEATLVTVSVETVHTAARTRETASCASYLCPGVTTNRTAAPSDCGGACTTLLCCDDVGVGFQEVELYGTPSVGGRPAGGGVLGEWCRGDVVQNHGVAGSAFTASRGRPYETLVRQSCLGSDVLTWADTLAPSLYGRTDLTLEGCVEQCDGHPECHGFDFAAATAACAWRGGVVVPGNYSDASQQRCLLPNLAYDAPNGTVLQSYVGDSVIGNASACSFEGGALAVPHLPAPLPLSLFAWVRLRAGCNETSAPIVSWSSAKRLSYTNTFSLEAGGALTWRVENGSRQVDRAVFSSNVTDACDGRWHSVGLAVGAEGDVAFFVDGVEVGADGESCCSTPHTDTDLLVLGAALSKDGVTATLDGLLHGVRITADAHQPSDMHDAHHSDYEPTATALPGGLTYAYRKLQGQQMLDASLVIRRHTDASVEGCQGYCSEEAACAAVEYATTRMADAYNTTAGTCTLYSAAHPRGSAADQAGSTHLDLYVRGGGVLRRDCGVVTLRPAGDTYVSARAASAVEANATTLVLSDVEDAVFLRYDLATLGLDGDDVASALLTLPLEDAGLLLYYTLDNTTRDDSGRADDAALGVGVSFTERSAVGVGSALFAGECPAIVGPPVESLAELNETSLMWSAWVKPSVLRGDVVTVDGTLALYFDREHLYCKVWTAQGEESVRTTGVGVVQPRLWQHVGCRYSGADGAKTLDVLYDGRVVASRANLTALASVEGTRLRVGCANATYAGYIDDVRVYRGDLSSAEVEAVASLQESCAPTAGALSISAVEAFADADVSLRRQPAVLLTVTRALAGAVGSGGAVTVDVTGLLRVSPYLRVSSASENNCSATLRVKAREANEIDQQAGAKLSVVTGCEAAVGTAAATACETCWPGVMGMARCDDRSRPTLRNTAAGDLRACLAHCESDAACKGVEWDATSGNCTTAAALCREKTLLTSENDWNETLRAFVVEKNAASDVLRTPATVTFDVRDAFLPSTDAASGVLLRLHVQAAAHAVRVGDCSLVATGPSGASVAHPIADVKRGDVLLLDVGHIVGAEGTPLLDFALSTECSAAAAANASLALWSRNHAAGLLPPALLLHAPGFEGSVGVRSADTAEAAATLRHGHAGLQVRFAVGDRLHRDVRLAWLRLPLAAASACRGVDVRLLDAEGGAVRVLRGLPLREGVPFDVTALVAEAAAGSEWVAFEVQAACVGRTASVDAAAHATLHLLYDASAEVLPAAGAGGADDTAVVGEDAAAALSFGAAPRAAAAGLLLMPVVATDADIARCTAVTVQHASGGTGYLSAPLSAGAGKVAGVALRPLLPLTPLNVALQLLRDDCSGYAHSFNVSAAVVVLRRGPYTRSVPGCLPAANRAQDGLRLAGTAGCREQDGEWAFLTDGVLGRRRLDVYGSFHPKKHEDFTVGFYFASPEPFDVTPSGTAGWLFSKAVGAGGTAAAAAGVGLRVGPDGSTLELVPGRNASGAEVVPVPAGFFRAWHRYVVVRRQAQMLLYVDGVLLAAYVPASPPATRDAGPTRFGGAADGTMEVRGFFSRLVLSHAAATGAALDGLFDSVLYEHVQAEVRGFAQSGLEYATSAGGCTQWYSTILVGTVPRCEEACTLSQACAMFSYDPALRRCRVHAAGPTCVPRDRGTGEVLYSKRPVATMVTPRGLSTVDSVWVSWNASTIVVGRGMSEGRHVLLTGVNEAAGPKSVALVQDDAGPQGHGWLFVEASPSERQTLSLEASATREVAGNAFTVTCTPDPTPEMVGAEVSATVAYVTPGDCAGMVGGGAGTPLYPCTVAVDGSSRAILFVLRGDSDVEVVLSEEPRVSACSDARAVTLQIDRRAFASSQVTSVRSGMCGSVLASAATDLITLGRAEWFWVTYTGGVVAFGRGQAAGEDVILTAPLPYAVRVSYVHVGTSGTAAVTADVYSSPRVVLSLPSLTVYPQRAQSVELSLSLAIFNSSVAVEAACDVYPTGIARVDTSLLFPFSAGDEQGARRSHFVTVTYLAAGGAFLRCWPSDTPPYHPSSVVSIPVTAVGTRPAGVGFVEDVLAISKWTEAHAHLHFGSVRLPLLRGELLHVARPEVISDLRVGYGGVYNGTTLPGYSQEHCAMEFSRLTPGFAVAAPPLDSLTFAATLLAADCDVDSTVAQECCPLMTTGWVEDTVAGVATDVQATSATLAVCGAYEARTLRFGVQRVRGHSVDFYYDVATPLNDTMTDVLAVKDAVTDTLSLYVDGRLVDHSTAGGALPIGTEAKGSEVVVGGGCFWREAKDAASTCPVLASTSASTLQECVDYAQGVAFANAVSLSYGASTCLVQNCTRVQREVHLQVEASPGNTTASLTSCSKAGFAGHVRRVRAWPRAVGCGEAFEEIDAGLRAAVDASDCDAVAGDHDRLRGGLAANEPNSDFEARCTVLDTSVVRLRQEHQVFTVPREEYGSLYSLPVEYVGPGRTELRCELGRSDGTHLALNQTGAAFVPVVDVVTIFASDAPGWTRLPDLPTGLLGGCSVVVGGVLHVFAGNTALRFAGGRWEGLAGSGVAFDGCACLPVVSGGGGGGGSEEEVLLFGCPHGVVLSYELRTRRFRRRGGYPSFEGYQRQSPMQLGRGALVYDSSIAAPTTTASGAFVSLRFDTRTVQRRRNPAEPGLDPMLAQPLVVESRSEAGADVYFFGEAAHRSNATRGSWGGAVAAGLGTHARDLWWSQRGLGSFVLNLCAGAALLGGLDAAVAALSPAMLPLYAADPRTGDAAVPGAAVAYPPLSRGVVGGTAAAGGGHVYHLGGLQAPSAEERFCAYDTRVGNGTDTVWRCAHELGAAAGVAGSLVVGFKMTDTFTAFSVGLAHSVCNDTLAQPATNERVGWNPCNGYVRVTVTREAVSVLQLQGGVESTVASMPIGVYTAVLGHHRRYLWIRWQRRNQAWRVIVGRGAHIGSNRVLTAAPPEQVYLNEAAYYYTTNDTYPTAKEGLGIHSIASDGGGDRSAQMLTHLSQFGMAACGQQGSCESSSGTCDCYNPNKRGTQCQECAADRQGALCGDYKPCDALYPHQPHKAEECAAWRDRGCRSVAHDVRFFLPSLNQTIRRFRLNSE